MYPFLFWLLYFGNSVENSSYAGIPTFRSWLVEYLKTAVVNSEKQNVSPEQREDEVHSGFDAGWVKTQQAVADGAPL